MMIKAIDNKIIVAELKRNKTTGGIVIPSTVTEPQAYGKIISIGDGVPYREDGSKYLKEGDVVVYHKMGGQAISLKNKIFCCVPYPEIYGILTDEDTLKELQEIEITEQLPKPAPSLIHKL
jgi:co-chaperonin GroES (HSP10)